MRALRLAPALAALALLGAAPPAPPVLDSAPVRRLDGERYVAAGEVARLLGATKFWRSDVKKLVLRAGAHRVQVAVDNPFVLIDDRTLWMRAPVRSLRGEVQIPVALLDSLPHDSATVRLVYDPRRDRVVALPAGGVLGTPLIANGGDRARITFPAEHAGDAAIAGRARERFRTRIGAYFTGSLPDTLTGDGLIRAIRQLPVSGGSAFEVEVAPGAEGWRLTRDESRIVLEFARRAGEGFEPFAAEGAHGPRPLRVVVIDPGHGGDDAGATAGDLVEKDLALRLAQRVKAEIEKRTHARVVLTRNTDLALNADQRAEAANRARADLVLSLHFDGYPSSAARGATAWCAPATLAETPDTPRGFALPVEVAPWRDVALRNAVPSRSLAEALRSSLELAGLGPVRVREQLPAALLGVSAPGVLLECATLTSPADRGRIASDDGLRALAAGIADGVVAYQRNE